MGVSIHYSGRILSENTTDDLVVEVVDICTIMDWDFHTFNDENLIGISFSPHPKCEPIMLTFHQNRLCSLLNFVEKLYDTNAIKDDMYFTCSTKTQFAGADAHIAIINLLDYLAKKYFIDFKLHDEGNYWETRSKEQLEKQMEIINKGINVILNSLSHLDNVPNETATSLADRIEQILKNKKK
jgi:hypothetical protein